MFELQKRCGEDLDRLKEQIESSLSRIKEELRAPRSEPSAQKQMTLLMEGFISLKKVCTQASKKN